jgi:hypothetical protein
MTPFPILDLRLEVHLEAPLKLPPFPGGLLRGAFGAALRRLSCMTGFRTCVGCPLRATCPFPLLFDPPPADLSSVGLPRAQDGLPPPFILRLPEADPGTDGRLVFGMRLIGHGIDRIAYVIEAWRRTFTHGLGPDRVRGSLLSVVRAEDAAPIWEGETIALPPPLARSSATLPAQLMLVTRSPLRLMAGGEPLPPERLTPRLLVAAIVRRARLLAMHADTAGRAAVREWPVGAWLEDAEGISHSPQLVWRDWHRWSSRQRRRMNLGGYVGQWAWADVPESVRAVLALGALLHVGKEASFGLGAIDLLAFPG